MARLLMILGIVLIVFAFIVLFFGTQFLDNPTVVGFLQGLYCKSGDTMQVATGPEHYDSINNLGAQPIYFSCVSPTGQVTDLGSGPFNNIALTYLVLFLPGMFLAMTGWSIGRNRKQAKAESDVPQYVKPYVAPWDARPEPRVPVAAGDLSDQLSQLEDAHKQGLISDHDYDEFREAFADANPVRGDGDAAADALEAVVDKLATAGAQPFSGDLTTRLKQLEEARSRGLISDDEYRLARQALLDSLGG